MSAVENFDVVIVGAGASGLMCASAAGQRGRKVLLLDHAKKVGKKILISGGGRCNFTNMEVEAGNYLCSNPHFCKSALSRFTQYDFLALVDKYGIAWHERQFGQLFCVNSAKEIVNLLIKECSNAGVRIQTRCTIEKISKGETFTVQTSHGDYTAESLVIATGGLSIPEIGATGFGYEVARQFGLKVLPCQPGLVSLTLGKRQIKTLSDLSGISIDAVVSCKGHSFRDALLFTHKGMSGPATLQTSNYWQPGDEIEINLLPDIDLAETIRQWRKERPKAELKNLIGNVITRRLGEKILSLSHPSKPVNQYTEKEILAIAKAFHNWRIRPSGTEGYRKAEVTRGGVDTDEISSKTFESKKVQGLYFTGEVLDVTGWLGGFNLQWAWASGYCAGQFV